MAVDWLCARLSHRITDAIVYVTQSVREVHERAGYASTRGVVIGNGVDLQRFQPPARAPHVAGAPIGIALVGRYDPVKGHHFLVDVVARHPQRDRLRLVMVGRGCDEAPALRDHIVRVGLADQCSLRGAERAPEAIYAAADIVALPSFAEAFPVTLLEAAASGAVIIASRVGENDRLGLDQSCLFGAGDAAGCAEALSDAIAEIDRPTGMRERNRAIAERFSMMVVADSYRDLYRSLVGEDDT